jgi:antitoxin (DNA-binding transcriptional repressor) of toxin-antitoxin stability system
MKTIELMPQPPSLEDLLEMATKEDGLTLTKAGQPVAQVIPLPEKPGERTAPLPRKLVLWSATILTSRCPMDSGWGRNETPSRHARLYLGER